MCDDIHMCVEIYLPTAPVCDLCNTPVTVENVLINCHEYADKNADEYRSAC